MEQESAEAVPPEWKYSQPLSAGYLYAGVILPVICLIAFGTGIFGPNVNWPSGSISDYGMLLLKVKPSLPFYPFLLYCMVCMTAMAIAPWRYSQWFSIRLGIYTGVILAIQYYILLGFILSKEFGLISVTIFAVLLFGCAWLIKWFSFDAKPRSLLFFLSFLMDLGMIVLLLTCFPLFYLFFNPMLCSTTWAVIAYVMLSWRLLRRNKKDSWQFSLAQLFIFISWLAAYFSAWRISVTLMLEEYAKLPIV